RENRQDWLENIQAFQLQSEGVDTKTMSDSTRAFNPEVILERMGEASLAGFAESSGENEQGDEFLGEREGEAPSAPHSSGTNKSQNTFDLGTAETQKAQPTHPVQKAVFENAEMLVKDGGGAIRIDIGNNETGKIDLAVEVKDGKVEVKISADSPEARQLIAQDLPRLKEQLQNQNLNLSKVEVGLSGGSSWTSSDGRSSREESSQSAQSEELLGVNGRPGRKTSRSYSRSSNTAEVQPGVIREGGGIKVRV
ncbi:MAG: flagellar hook-length control protein FliK, partial [Bdellovibrionota bacterium]